MAQAHFTLTTFNPFREFALVAENRAAMLQWVKKLQEARSYFHATQDANAFKRPAKHILGHAMPNLIMGASRQPGQDGNRTRLCPRRRRSSAA